MTTRKTMAILACLPMFALSACGSDEPADPQLTSTTATPTPTPTPSATTTSEQPTTEQQTSVEHPADEPAEYQQPANAAPTFDANSADGYGPNQELPPLCERFPGQFDCNGNPIQQAPTECIGFGCSPEQDAELAQTEGNATANFWNCMNAGGTEETCRQ